MRPAKSSPTNGSSIRSNSNGRTKARAIAAFWRSPRLNVVGSSSARVGHAEHLAEGVAVLLPVLEPVQSGEVLEVLTQAEVVVEDRLVAQVRRRGACLIDPTALPKTATEPVDDSSSPATMRSSVVLPLPLWPSSAIRSPASTVRSNGPTAGASP